MKANFFKIEALTNMHVGSGNANYGIIDNLVQRDPVTDLPTINGSSLKGALREFFESQWTAKDETLIEIFGSEYNNAGYRFLSANLLAIPVRSNKKAWFMATAPMLINNLAKDSETFNCKIDLTDFMKYAEVTKGTPIVFTNTAGLLIEDFEHFEQKTIPPSPTILGEWESLVIFNDEDFKLLCSDTSLPVIARNKLGENKNLWYEQVVPHKSLFTFVVLHNNQHFAEFEKEFANNIVHIGANATVGYGFTKITKIV